MFFQPATFMNPQLGLTHAFAGHATHTGPSSLEVFSGVALSTAATNRYIVAFIGNSGTDIDEVLLDGVEMTKINNRAYIIAKPTGATGTFTVNMADAASYLSVAVFAVYGDVGIPIWDGDYNNNLGSGKVDVAAGGVVIGYYFVDGGADTAGAASTSGLTARLNTTVDGRRVWAGSDVFAVDTPNKTWSITNSGDVDDREAIMISLAPLVVPQINPSVLGANLIGWWDPSDAANRTLVSGKVSALTDKSGNGRTLTQGTDANRPVLTVGGLGSRDCMAVSDGEGILNTSIPLGGTNVDAFVVGTLDENASDDNFQRILSFTAAGHAGDWDNIPSFAINRYADQDALRVERDSSDVGPVYIGYGVPFVGTGWADGSSVGIIAKVDEPGGIRVTDLNGTFGATGTLRIGLSTAADGWNGKIGEVVFAKNLTRTQRRGIRAYLRARWSVTA